MTNTRIPPSFLHTRSHAQVVIVTGFSALVSYPNIYRTQPFAASDTSTARASACLLFACSDDTLTFNSERKLGLAPRESLWRLFRLPVQLPRNITFSHRWIVPKRTRVHQLGREFPTAVVDSTESDVRAVLTHANTPLFLSFPPSPSHPPLTRLIVRLTGFVWTRCDPP